MGAFWDVLLADFVALAKFAGVALVVALPAAALGAAIRGYFQKPISWRVVRRAALRGTILALLAALAAAMLFANWVLMLTIAGIVGTLASFSVAHLQLRDQGSP